MKNAKADSDRVKIYCELCSEFDNAGLADSGVYYGFQGLILAKSINNKFLQALSHRRIGNAYFSLGEFEKDLSQQQQSLSICKTIKNKKGMAAALGNIGIIYQTLGDNAKALDYQKQSLEIEKELRNDEGMAVSMDNIASIHFNLGHIPLAMLYRQKAIAIQTRIKDKAGLARTLVNHAGDFSALGDYPKAIELDQKALKMMEELNNQYAIAIILGNIGNIYMENKDNKKALYYYKKSLKITEQIDDKYNAALINNNLGDLCFATKDNSMAKYYYEKSLAISEEIDYKPGIADTWVDLASMYAKKSDPKAIVFLQKAYDLGKAIERPLAYTNALKGMAEYYAQQGNNKLAIEKANEALRISIEQKDLFSAEESYRLLYLTHKSTNDFRSALSNYENYIVLRDSLFNSDRTKLITQKEMQYEFDKTQMKQKAEQDKKDLATREEKQKQRLVILFVSLGLLIVIIFLAVLFNRFRLIQKQKKVIEAQKAEVERQKLVVDEKNHEIEEKQKEIIDSINYAKRIQFTLLAHEDFLKQNLPEHFVFFNPKDIVSGDFYWAAKRDDKFYVAACDSTGHGVPGAFMSLLNIGFLSEAINEKGIIKPNEVLNFVRQRLIDNISKEGQKDGFDGILVCIDKVTNKITYAAANNAPVLVSKGELIEMNADKMPVGIGERKQDFELFEIDIEPGDSLYLYTDGFADQFGGPKGKKFMYKKMDELIRTNSVKPLHEQKEILKASFEEWKGDLEQVDDVCVIGIRF